MGCRQQATMSYMFQSSAFNRDIGNWNVGSVTTMAYMFNQNGAFNGDISGWNPAKVTSMAYMFTQAASSTET